MRQKRLKSPAREFKDEEKPRLINYFLADCPEGKDSQVEKIVDGVEADYATYVERFVAILNKKGSDYTNPRRIVRKLWESDSLRKCQLLPAFTHAHFCVERLKGEAEFRSWLGQVASTTRAILKVQRAHKQLRKTLQRQANRVAQSFVGPGAKAPQLTALAAASDYIQAIDGMEQVQTRKASIQTFKSHLSVFRRMARDQAMGVDHPGHARVSAIDLAEILPLLEQSITGSKSLPTRNYLVDYSPENLLKDVARMTQDETLDRIKKIAAQFERVMPGFSDRIAFEPYEDIPKQPLEAPLPIEAAEVLALSEIHAFFRNSPQRELIWDKLNVMLEGVLVILQNPKLSNKI